MWIRTVSGLRFFDVEYTSQGIPCHKAKKLSKEQIEEGRSNAYNYLKL